MSDHHTPPRYGFPDACAASNDRHPQWSAVMQRLWLTISSAFTRQLDSDTQDVDTDMAKFVYFYGNLVAEDFGEVFLMAVNGYGYGATKLLRPMYEHTVTLKYLHDHPDELQPFRDFDRVQQYKLMKPILDTFGDGVLAADIVEDTEQRYAEVKDKFMVKS